MNLSDTDQAPYSAPAPQNATVSDEAVQGALEAFTNTARTQDGIRAALTAALPHLTLSAAPCSVEAKKLPCDVQLPGAIFKRGVSMSTLITALQRRESWPDEDTHLPAKPVDVAAPTKEERHANTARNIIINRTSTDLEKIIYGHDPDHSILNNDVWDRLDKMACEIEALSKPVDVAAVREQTLEIHFMQRVWANLYFDEHDAGYTFQQTLNDVVDWLSSRNALPDIETIKTSAIRALSPADPVGQWQDIATAPKDGSEILVCTTDGLFEFNDGYLDEHERMSVLPVRWGPKSVYSKKSEPSSYAWMMYYCWQDGSYNIYPTIKNATHWMPLPAAPTSKGGE